MTPDSTLAVTNTCPKDGVHLSDPIQGPAETHLPPSSQGDRMAIPPSPRRQVQMPATVPNVRTRSARHDPKRIQVEGYACCGVRPVLVIVRPRHDSCRHRPTASPPIVDCYVDRRLAAARASRFCFSRVANARSRAFSATPCCSDSGRDAIQALSGALPAHLRFQRRVSEPL